MMQRNLTLIPKFTTDCPETNWGQNFKNHLNLKTSLKWADFYEGSGIPSDSLAAFLHEMDSDCGPFYCSFFPNTTAHSCSL